jgi:hypothetical protein
MADTSPATSQSVPSSSSLPPVTQALDRDVAQRVFKLAFLPLLFGEPSKLGQLRIVIKSVPVAGVEL